MSKMHYTIYPRSSSNIWNMAFSGNIRQITQFFCSHVFDDHIDIKYSPEMNQKTIELCIDRSLMAYSMSVRYFQREPYFIISIPLFFTANSVYKYVIWFVQYFQREPYLVITIPYFSFYTVGKQEILYIVKCLWL